MYTTFPSPSMQLAALAAALAVGTAVAVYSQTGTAKLVQFDTELPRVTDDRGSGRIGRTKSLSKVLDPHYLLGFRGSGRIHDDPKGSAPSSSKSNCSAPAVAASTFLAYRGSGRITPTQQMA